MVWVAKGKKVASVIEHHRPTVVRSDESELELLVKPGDRDFPRKEGVIADTKDREARALFVDRARASIEQFAMAL
jgi:hypothetical protein